ncbi:hypothetical protein A7K91_00880 [Paenibacillus oryzae]|uniref:Uncharacterized protein n=1 Tax=Paenibacillus oryzae TaxID=1844972 RepID=A0A1A5YA07_9BACL|nr:hypothetical protein A7K91_00880 [Paenibacillus oryzae]
MIDRTKYQLVPRKTCSLYDKSYKKANMALVIPAFIRNIVQSVFSFEIFNSRQQTTSNKQQAINNKQLIWLILYSACSRLDHSLFTNRED